jgi:hypothetical protein
MLAFRVVIPLYMVIALSQFITYLLILIVGEKENKIKEGMKIMGLKDSVFWYAYFSLNNNPIIIAILTYTSCFQAILVYYICNFRSTVVGCRSCFTFYVTNVSTHAFSAHIPPRCSLQLFRHYVRLYDYAFLR